MVPRIRCLAVASATLIVLVAASKFADAQPVSRTTAAEMVQLELTGRVERVFASESRADDARVVELVLRSVALAENSGHVPSSGRLPAPGEMLFVLVDDAAFGARPRDRRQPEELRPGDSIRAVVQDAGRGVWIAAGSNWFEPLAGGETDPPRDDVGPDTAAAGPAIALRGMTCEVKIVRDRLVIEVASVDQQGPAAEAGFQPGDLIVAIDGKPLASVAAIRTLAEGAQPLDLSVVDVNSGRLAEVKLAAPPAVSPADNPRDRPGNADPATRIEDALGITLEAGRGGQSGAVKVVTVTRGEPGGEAGLEPGDVITAVDDRRVATVADFADALPTRGGRITLKVRDVRSGREVPIEAEANSLRESPRDRDLPRDEPPAPANAPPADRLGLSIELTFYEAEAAVRVVAVKPGSPASRAGVRPGAIILKANNAAVMHPDDLAKAAASGRVTLVVVDPATERQSTITLTP
jgi:S1-C subfamily serine protease